MVCTKSNKNLGKSSEPRGICRPCHWRTVRFALLFLISVGAIVGVYQFRSNPEESDEKDSLTSASSARASTSVHNVTYTSTRRPSAVFDINDVITHDRWVVLQPWGTDDVEPGTRPEGDESNADIRELLTCAVVEASVEQGWRPLVLAERITCCSKPRCVLLHAGKRARLPYELRPFLERLNGTTRSKMAAQRNLAFLFAIQHGARFVMDWYLEQPYPTDLRAVGEYQRRATQLLQSATLDVSLGLVLERASDAPLFAVSPRPMRRVYNPHAHFGRPDLWAKGFKPPEQRHVSLGLLTKTSRGRLVPRWAEEPSPPPRRRASAQVDPSPRQRYRVCELRPPSIEKFLHQHSVGEGAMDLSAPAVVIPGDTLAPASAQTSLYTGEALWALALLPGANLAVPDHLLRTLWAYPLLANIAASVKISLSPLPPPAHHVDTVANITRAEQASAELSAAVLRWRCSSRSTLTCVAQLGRDLAPHLGADAAAFLATWANDLRRLRYLEPPVVPLRRGGLRSPCLGHHGLGGLAFQAAPLEPASPLTREEVDRRTRARGRYSEELILLDWIRQLDSSHNNDTESTGDSMTSFNNTNSEIDPPVITELPSLEKFMTAPYNQAKRDAEQSSIQRETVDGMCLGFSDLLPSRPSRDFTNMLLVVSFSAEGGYDTLPMIEIMYRPHFQNILYCGPPHASLDIYTHKFQVAENRTLSYLPASASGFECLVGAMEMGYHVDDYLFATADSLLLPWTIANLDRSHLWYGSEIHNDDVISKKEWREIDPGGQKLPRVVEALGQALKFVAHLLGVHEPDHEDHELDDDMMPEEEGHVAEEHTKDKNMKPATTSHEEPEVSIPELHLHAEGITDGITNSSGSVYSYDTKDHMSNTEVLNTTSVETPLLSETVEIKLHEEPEVSSQQNSESVSVADSGIVMLHDGAINSAISGHIAEKETPEVIHLLPAAEEDREEKSEIKTPTEDSEIFKEDGVDDFRLPDVDQSNESDTQAREQDDVIMPPEAFDSDVEIKLQKSSETFDNPAGGAYTITDNVEIKLNGDNFNKSSDIQQTSSDSPTSEESPNERHSVIDEILEDVEVNQGHEPHSTVNTEDASPSIGLQDVASENPADDGIIQYILSSTPTAHYNDTSDQPTIAPSAEIPWPTSNETLDEELYNSTVTEDELPSHSNKKDDGIHSHELHISSSFDTDGDSALIVLEEGAINDKQLPAYQLEDENVEIHEKTDLNNDQFNITSFLDIDELTDSSLNPVHDTLSSQTAEEIEKNAENGFAKRKAEHVEEVEIIKSITKREVEAPLLSYMERRMERTFRYIEELISSVITRLNNSQEIPIHNIPNTQGNNRLDPREFKHLRCHDTGMPSYHTNTDLCQSLRQFFTNLNDLYHRDGDFTPPYTSYPVYHVPASQQKAFYLLANVFLQFGVPDQVAVPLLLRGLALPGQAIELRRTFFGSDTPATVQPGYPLFDEKANFLFPVSLQRDLHGDTRYRTVFCLKYLYNMLS